MPNGGTPMHMVMNLHRDDSPVVWCKGSEIRIFARDEWEQSKGDGTPLITLNSDESLVLQRFLRYWGGDKGEGPIEKRENVDVVYDF